MNYELLAWANWLGYWTSPLGTHGLTHWANGLPMGLNNNRLGRPLARWAIGFLGRAVNHELFDDP